MARRPLISVFVLVTLVHAQDLLPSFCSSSSTLCGLAESGRLAGLRWPDFSDLRAQVLDFYKEREYLPAWTHSGNPTPQAFAVIDILNGAGRKGLNAEDYDSPRWTARLGQLHESGNSRESRLAEFDVALTVSLSRYVSDIHFGRANPGLFHSRLDPQHEQFDLPGLLRQLTNAPDVAAVLEKIEPPFEGYWRTVKALQVYRELARDDVHLPLPLTAKPVEPGSSYDGVHALTRLLRRLGDLPANAPASDIYDGALVEAVKRFQQRHGLAVDGRIGRATLAQLNTPLSHRVRQLEFTLERWRWVPHSFAHPPIIVNIPEFKLRALDRSYKTELAMKVVVGKAYRNPTPVFGADMIDVIFRPYWNVPLSIQRAELVPKIERDRSYLASNDYEIVTPEERVTLNASTGAPVDDATLAQIRSGRLRIRQIPGPNNALGMIKFLFPNEYDVYMHATPATELFSRIRRDFSHGCIRAEKPEQLADWVLRDQPEWTPARIAQTTSGTQTVQVKLSAQIPVLIVYATAVVPEEGGVLFFEDIYRQDASLEEQLARGYPTPGRKPTSGARAPRPRE